MSTELSAPDFDQLANLLLEEGAVTFSPSELHGILVGQVAAGQRFEVAGLAQFCAQQLDLDQLSQPSTAPNLGLLYKQVLAQMESGDFELNLLLPDDEHSLAQRAEQLGLWVTGFIAGFGLGAGESAAKLSTEAQESIGDLVQIAQIETDSESEEDEGLLMEVEEYVRMAAMLLFAECNTPPETSDVGAPTIH
ncbi:MAG: UPF0149 family protein [Oceanospirillaceae bacterium]|nr:UPF0149 family protein [Oceanospirillaceae bacterium]